MYLVMLISSCQDFEGRLGSQMFNPPFLANWLSSILSAWSFHARLLIMASHDILNLAVLRTSS